MPEDKPLLALAGGETSLVCLTALAGAMDLLGFSCCRVCELEEGFGIREGKNGPFRRNYGNPGKKQSPGGFFFRKQ